MLKIPSATLCVDLSRLSFYVYTHEIVAMNVRETNHKCQRH